MNNSHLIKVKYIPPTNSRGSRVKFTTYDVRSYDDRKKPSSIYESYFYECDGIHEQALQLFKKAGLKVIAANSNQPSEDIFLLQWDIEAMKKLFKVKGE